MFIFYKAAEKSEDEKSATESEKPEPDTEKAASSEKKEEGEEAKEEGPPEKPYENPMLVHVSYLWILPPANWLQRFI